MPPADVALPAEEAQPLPTETKPILDDTFEPAPTTGTTYDRSGKLKGDGAKDKTTDVSADSKRGPDGKPISEEDIARIQELKQVDSKVRAHEQAHMAAGAGLVKGGASYSYVKGPDGNLYAVAGEVGIDTSEGKTPRETIMRMQRVQAAAMAPADPSPQDRAVAAAAAAKAAKATGELALENMQKAQGADAEPSSDKTKHESSAIKAYQKNTGAGQPTSHAIHISA